MKNLKLYTLLLIGAFMTFSCDEEDKLISDILEKNPLPDTPETTGAAGDSLDVSQYISIGNSLTGGFQDGALYTDGQLNCFPALLSKQFQIKGIGGGAYGFPDVGSKNGYSSADKDGKIYGKLILDLDANNDQELGDVEIVKSVGELPGPYAGDKKALTNFGVPGIQLAQLRLAATGGPDAEANPAYNGLYARFASNPGTSTILGDAIAAKPTFFTLWIGANDVLGYAIGGGVKESLLTDPGTFGAEYGAVLTALAGTGAYGVVLNIPPIIIQPFFQAVQYNSLALDETNATALNTGLAGYNGAVQGLVTAGLITTQAEADARKVSYAAGNNSFLIEDDQLTDLGPKWDVLVGAEQMTTAQRTALEPYRKCRQIKEGELVLLSASTVINTTPEGFPATALYGLSLPLPDKYTLTGDEVTKIVTQRFSLNLAIDQVFAGGIPSSIKKYDVQPLFADLMGLDATKATSLKIGDKAIARADGKKGIVYQGYNYQPDFSPNGLFSNDAIHPNPRGHAIIANEIIDLLNKEFGAKIPSVQVNQLRASPFQQ